MGSGRTGLLQPRPKKPNLVFSNAQAMNFLHPLTDSNTQDSGLQQGCRVPVGPAGVLSVAVVGVADFNWNVIHISGTAG